MPAGRALAQQGPPRRAARALALSAFVRACADVVLYAHLPLHVYAVLGERRLWFVSLILAVPNLVRVPAAALWGAAVDRSGRVPSSLLLGMAAYAAALAFLAFSRSAAWTAGTVCALAAPASAYTPTARTYLMRGPNGRQATLAGWLRGGTAGWVAGRAAMTLLAGRAPGTALPALAAALAVVALAGLWRGVPDPPPPAPPGRGAEMAAGGPAPCWALVRWTAAYVGLATLLAEGVFAVLGVYLTQVLGAPPALYGAALTGTTLLALWAYGPLGRLAAGGRAP